MSFAERLKKVRNDRDYSQEDLSYEMDVSRQAVTKWETGNGFPEVENLFRLAAFFQVSLDWLFEDELREHGYISSAVQSARKTEMPNLEINMEVLKNSFSTIKKQVIPTGIECIDESIDGLARGYVYYILGATSIGRFSLALNVVSYNLQKKRNVMLVLKNHTKKEALKRAINIGANIDSSKSPENYTPEERMRINNIVDLYSRTNFILDDSYEDSIERLHEKCINNTEQLDLIVIDSFSRLRTVYEYKNEDDKIRNIITDLNCIARECKCPILVLDWIENSIADDLRNHEAIEETVDRFISLREYYKHCRLFFVHRDDYYTKNHDSNISEISLYYYNGLNEDKEIQFFRCAKDKGTEHIVGRSK